MRRVILGVLVSVFGLSAVAEPITEEAVVEALQNLALSEDDKPQSLSELMAEHYTPGVSVAVFDNYEIVYAEGFGLRDAKTEEPVDTETRFQAASISKPVAAVAVLTLVQEGKVDLDLPVNKYLTSWQVPFHEWAGVHPATLRLIMGHISGFTVHGFSGYSYRSEVPSTVQILNGTEPANSAAIFVDTQPGTLYRYSGGGYTVMQLAVEDLTATPFPEFVHERVLQPVGMTRSGIVQPPTDAFADNIASAHTARGRVVRGQWHAYPEYAAAGLWTTATDLAKFAIDVQKAYRGDEGMVLTPAMAREALEAVSGSRHGLGFTVGDNSFGHGGSNRGFRCQLVASKDGGRGYAIMTNAERGDGVMQLMALSFRKNLGVQ